MSVGYNLVTRYLHATSIAISWSPAQDPAFALASPSTCTLYPTSFRLDPLTALAVQTQRSLYPVSSLSGDRIRTHPFRCTPIKPNSPATDHPRNSNPQIEHMAVIRERRPPPLTLQPPTDVFATAADCLLRFPLPPLPPPVSTSDHRLSDFEKLNVLGHGNGGTVYKVRHRRTAAVYALKLLHHDPSLPRGHAARESDILRRTDSPFVVRCHSAFLTPTGDSALVLEHMDAGSLDSLLLRSSPFPEPAIAEVARQALLGLAYLHSHQIVHRDIKPSNLLVNRSGEIKIADFGVGKIMRRSLDPCLSYVGTCAYMSPERFDPDAYGGEYDAYAADVWSLGLTLLELHLGHFPLLPPGQRPDWSALMCAICFGEPPALPESASDDLRGFIGCCLQKESGKRWSVSQLLSHPFIADRDAAESLRAFIQLLARSEC